MTKDWVAWHAPYDDASSALTRRVRIVRRLIADRFDEMPPGPIGVVSICAGQGHDLLEVLSSHPRAADVRARLVELDRRMSRPPTLAAMQPASPPMRSRSSRVMRRTRPSMTDGSQPTS